MFALATSSLPLIEALVSRRFPDLSQVDARTTAEFSGGNARIALALASTVAKNETIAGLSDEDLFRRLFHQRHDRDASLLSIAQVCSLVYSFEGEDVSSDESELSILGGLIGRASTDVFSGVAELRRRDLLQSRGPWRAVLPPAIANRLSRRLRPPWKPPDRSWNTGLVPSVARRWKKPLHAVGGSNDCCEGRTGNECPGAAVQCFRADFLLGDRGTRLIDIALQCVPLRIGWYFAC